MSGSLDCSTGGTESFDSSLRDLGELLFKPLLLGAALSSAVPKRLEQKGTQVAKR